MSRSGYSDDCWGSELAMYRGQVASAIRGKRGQAFLRDLVDALDAMPEKKLIAHELQTAQGVCAIGCVGVKRGVDMHGIDPENHYRLSKTFDIACQLVAEVEFVNDDDWSLTRRADSICKRCRLALAILAWMAVTRRLLRARWATRSAAS